MGISFRLLIILHIFLMSMITNAAPSTEKHLTMVIAGNIPDIGIHTYGSYPGLAGLLEKVRAENTPTIFTFIGGSLGPSPLSSLDKGSHIIDILNTLEPDLMTLTKREFSYSEDELTLRSYEAAFPIVSSNLYDPLMNGNLEGILTSIIIEKDNTRVGFISILDEEVVEEYLLQRARVFEPREMIQQQISTLKQEGAELVVLIYSKERDYYQALISENKIDFALRVQNEAEQHSSKRAYSVTSRDPFILLRMNWKTGNTAKNLTIEASIIDDAYQPIDPTTPLLVEEYNQRLHRLLNQEIGFFGNKIQTLRNLVRTREMPFGNFIADAMKSYAQTDIGVINSGVIRGNKSYKKGTIITRRDIATELPFRTHITVLYITGQELRQALENSVSQVESAKGRFLQVSGISFTYSLEKPPGERIQTIHINGTSLDPKQKYSVITSDYLANGGDGYDMFLNTPRHEQNTQNNPLLSDIVTHAIQQQKTISPKAEHRIKRVTE